VPFADLPERRVYYEEHGRGPAVLLVNGLNADHTAWELQTAFLQGHFRVLVFDNPGIGRTEGPTGPYTSALFADVAAQLLGYLGVANAHIVGASMGGTIAQQLAVRHPELVRSLVLHCTWGRVDNYLQTLLRVWQACARALDPLEAARERWLWVFTPRWYEDRPDAIAELEQQVTEAPYPQSAQDFCDQAEACITHDALDDLSAITAPTLVTVGDSDLLTPPRHSIAIKERLPNALLHVWPNMGHAPFWETPREFNELNYSFLASH